MARGLEEAAVQPGGVTAEEVDDQKSELELNDTDHVEMA